MGTVRLKRVHEIELLNGFIPILEAMKDSFCRKDGDVDIPVKKE